MMTEAMTIGILAKKAGVGVETIRFYEREKLLPRPERTVGNYRAYAPAALARLNFIRQAKNLGFTLDEIRRLLRMSENEASDAGDFHAIAREKIAWLDRRMEEMCSMRATLTQAVAACPGHGSDKSACPVLALFTGEATGHPQHCRCPGCESSN
jgi:DNA-binding transcriptional MerR regulator